LVTDSAMMAVLIVFAVPRLKLTHALIRFVLCVLDWSIVLIGYYTFNISRLSALKLILCSIDSICMGSESAATLAAHYSDTDYGVC